MSILDIKHCQGNKVIWEDKDLPNLFNQEGETFVLSVAFDTDGGMSVPSFYYIGLDNRTSISFNDTMESITGEPTSGVNGYTRQLLSSATGFSVALSGSHMKATSGIVTFSGIGGSWGPVSNVFFTNASDTSGLLLASVALSSTRTVASGDTLTVRFGLALTDCS